MSAAHELVERGFDVDVYEAREIFGGKARSMGVPDSASDGRKPLPGEHGFRFFPSFYRHLFDTMRRIPYGDNDEGVFDNLTAVSQWLSARKNDTEITLPVDVPDSIEDWDTVLDYLLGNPLEIPDEETQFFADRLLTFLTTCEERRKAEYEDLPWWEFIEAERMSKGYQELYGIGVTRGLVAMRAEESSTRTIGKIYIQLLLGIALPWLHVDSLLDGPTNDVWIDPWVTYLDQQGVTFYPESTVDAIETDGKRVTGVTVTHDGDARSVDGDYYIAALPVEDMADLIDDPLVEAAPSLADIDQLETAWMNGIQYYLDRDVPITDGHTIYQGAPWALTSISQNQFWDDVDLADYGNGEVDGILSICISNWTAEGENIEKPAKECTPDEIKEEVWAQMAARLNDDERHELEKANVVDWFLDPSVEFPAPNETTNADPLLINTVGSLQYRPEADLQAPNLFVASDYVRTNTDLATMEGANEAARRAVNGILADLDSDAERCDIWELDEPTVFEPMKAYDRLRFEMGLPHQNRSER